LPLVQPQSVKTTTRVVRLSLTLVQVSASHSKLGATLPLVRLVLPKSVLMVRLTWHYRAQTRRLTSCLTSSTALPPVQPSRYCVSVSLFGATLLASLVGCRLVVKSVSWWKVQQLRLPTQ